MTRFLDDRGPPRGPRFVFFCFVGLVLLLLFFSTGSSCLCRPFRVERGTRPEIGNESIQTRARRRFVFFEISRLSPYTIAFHPLLLGFTGFYWVLPSFTEFYRVLLDFYRVLLGFTGFYRVLPSFTGFYRVLPSFTGFYSLFTFG